MKYTIYAFLSIWFILFCNAFMLTHVHIFPLYITIPTVIVSFFVLLSNIGYTVYSWESGEDILPWK